MSPMNLGNSHGNYVDIDQIDQMRQPLDSSPFASPYGDLSKFQRNYSMNQNHPHTFENHFSLMQTYSGNNLADASPFTKQYSSTTRKDLHTARQMATTPLSTTSLPKTSYILDTSPIYENQQQIAVDMSHRSESPIYSNTNSSLMSLYHPSEAAAVAAAAAAVASAQHQPLRNQSSISSTYAPHSNSSDLIQPHAQTNIYSNIMSNEMPLYSNVRTSAYDVANTNLWVWHKSSSCYICNAFLFITSFLFARSEIHEYITIAATTAEHICPNARWRIAIAARMVRRLHAAWS